MIYTLTLNPAIDRELTIPRLEMDSVLRANSARVDFGGKGINVSRVLLALGTPSIASGFLGGNTGIMLQEGLNALGIPTDFVWLDEETRVNISVVAEQDGHSIKVNESGPTIDLDHQKQLLKKITKLARVGDWWVMAGNLPPGIPQNFYASILAILHRHHIFTVLDTSGEALHLGLHEKPYLIKPNTKEANILTGMPVETIPQLKTAASSMRNIGAQNVIISLGSQGAILQTEHATYLAHAPTVEQKNPIGAGDSMVGGLVYALNNRASIKEALAWGTACGAATASLPGTQVGDKSLVCNLLSKVHVEEI